MDKSEADDLRRSIAANIEKVQRRLALACERGCRYLSTVKVIAVSKNFPAEAVRMALQCGLKHFGENRVQEAQSKYAELGDMRTQLTLHFIGHLQTNKVKEAVKTVDIIQSVDSLRLANMLNENAAKKLPVLIQVNIAEEETKYGFPVENLDANVKSIRELQNLEVLGLMTIAPAVDDPENVRPIFRKLRDLNEQFGFKELSMGMTDDFEVAVEEGATMIRIGRAIFGERS
ncbi:MAG: YggS family pyridoxal phosphate-dependent enzyme [Dehalococcoidia bacterium]